MLYLQTLSFFKIFGMQKLHLIYIYIKTVLLFIFIMCVSTKHSFTDSRTISASCLLQTQSSHLAISHCSHLHISGKFFFNLCHVLSVCQGSPLGQLYKCVQERIRVKVHIRTFKGLRGVCSGFVVAFDKFWNMVNTSAPVFPHDRCQILSLT